MIAGFARLRRRQHDRAGAVAEEYARRAIGVVDDARHDVGADHERVVVRAARDHLHAGRQRVGEARAGGAEVEAPGRRRADLVLQHARGAGEDRVRRRRADDDEADVGRARRRPASWRRAPPPSRGRTSPCPDRRCGARECRCAAGSIRSTSRRASRDRRWSARAAARNVDSPAIFTGLIMVVPYGAAVLLTVSTTSDPLLERSDRSTRRRGAWPLGREASGRGIRSG